MTGKPAAPRATAHIRDAWTELRAIAVAARGSRPDGSGDWDPEDTEQAIYAWEIAGLPFGDALRETYRCLWDPEGSPAEIRGTARARSSAAPAGYGVTREERDELIAIARERIEAATEAQHEQARARDVA